MADRLRDGLVFSHTAYTLCHKSLPSLGFQNDRANCSFYQSLRFLTLYFGYRRATIVFSPRVVEIAAVVISVFSSQARHPIHVKRPALGQKHALVSFHSGLFKSSLQL